MLLLIFINVRVRRITYNFHCRKINGMLKTVIKSWHSHEETECLGTRWGKGRSPVIQVFPQDSVLGMGSYLESYLETGLLLLKPQCWLQRALVLTTRFPHSGFSWSSRGSSSEERGTTAFSFFSLITPLTAPESVLGQPCWWFFFFFLPSWFNLAHYFNKFFVFCFSLVWSREKGPQYLT